MTFHWESFTTAGGPYTTVSPDSASAGYTINPTSTAWYRASVTCSGIRTFSDSVQIIVPPLFPGGTYTINSAVSTGGTNFQTFTDAVNAIKCGFSGPIVFNVISGSGPYNEQVVIPNMNTSSAINTVTFNGNGATLAFASADANARAVLKLDGADFVTIKNLVIDATTGTYGWGVHFTNQADNDSLVNCIINTDLASTSTNFAGIIISGSNTSPTTVGNTANNTVISGNTVNGGYYGISNYGNSIVPYTDNVKILNNAINDFYLYGIFTYGSTNPVISGNTIKRPIRTVLSAAYGIYLSTYTSGAMVDGNKIQNLFDGITTSTSAAYCMYITGDGTVTAPNKITNNLISDISSEGTIYGIYNSGSAYMQAYHNTISIDYASSAAGIVYGFYQITSDVGIEFINNIVTITRGGSGVKYGIYLSTSTTPLLSNYNDIYVNSTGSGLQGFGYFNAIRTTLADWQTASTLDLNSLSIDPIYTSLGTDYKPTAVPLNDRGTPVGVTIDITGAVRSSLNPDLGAYEFTVSGCTSPPTPGDATSLSPTVCANFPFTLQLINNSAGLGQTYQWQSAVSSSGPWSPVGTPINNPDTSITANATLYYRAAVTCGASTAFSTPVLISVTQPVSGTYTINNSLPTGGTNFQSFADAINAIKCGITGPTVFNVVSGSGPYNEQVIIPSISGSSSTNKVTFNGNGATLQFASADANARSVIQLNGSDYVTIKDLVIDATGGTYGWGIHLTNQADNDTIVNCTVTTDGASTSTNFCGVVISGSNTSATTSGNNANNTVIMGNTINGGYYGLMNYGNAAIPYTDNVKIINNIINDFYFYGIYTYGSTNPVISGNILQRLTRSIVTTAYGIYATTGTIGALIEKNKVHHLYDAATTSTSTAYCIYLISDATASTSNTITNNLISDINHDGSIYGIYNGGARNSTMYHNTISFDNASANAGLVYGYYQSASDTSISFENNIISITRGGSGTKYGLYISSTIAPLPTCNYNDIYVNSTGSGSQYTGYLGGTTYVLLTDWQTATSFDINSVSIDPIYVSSGTDYKPTAVSLNDRGTPVGILTDITGAARSTVSPDLGAYEFTVSGCTSPPVAGDASSLTPIVCANTPFTLHLTNNSAGLGQTYLWESASSTTGPWTPVGSAISNPDTTITALATLYYHAAVTCGTSTTFSTPVQININPAMPGGNYTINSAIATGGTNFQTFSDAINAIKCGVSGAIVFNVLNGPYTEQITLPIINGTSATNTITFNGNGSTISFASADANNRHVIKLDGADYVTIKNFNIECFGGTYGWGIHLTKQADYDSIVGCTITTDPASTSSNHCGIVISGSNTSATTAGDNADNAVIMGNTVNNGYYGIINYGQAAAPFNDNVKIINNTINDFYLYGIYTYGTTNTVVSGNTIQRVNRSTLTTTYGLYFGSANTGMLVDKNRIHHLYDLATTSTSTTYAIYCTAVGLVGGENKITNNLISDINSDGTIYGIYNSGSAYMLAYHNTISLDNTASLAGSTYGFYQTTSALGIEFKNNIITITRGGTGAKYAVYKSTSTTPFTLNNNDYYVNSTGTGTQAIGYLLSAQTTLANWQTASGQDANSVSIDPLYTSASTGNYKPSEATLDNLGAPLGVVYDIVDVTRSSSNPDMGAYEFGSIVPVSLKDISASINNKDVLVKWLTSSEINTNRFEVERSQDAINFVKAGSVKAASSGVIYSFVDYEIVNRVPANAIVYYRLKMIDNDGRYRYSPVVSVKTGKADATITVSPNPFTNKLFVKLQSSETTLGFALITDMAGRTLRSIPEISILQGENILTINKLEGLAKGMYIFKLTYNNHEITHKIIKE